MIKININLERPLADMFDKIIEYLDDGAKAQMICDNISIDGIQPTVYDGCVSLNVKGRGIPPAADGWEGDDFDVFNEHVSAEVTKDGNELRGRSGGHLCLTSMPFEFYTPSTYAFENVINEFIDMSSIALGLSSVIYEGEDAIIGALEDAGFYEYFRENIGNMIYFTAFESIVQKASDKVKLFETDAYWSELIPAKVVDDVVVSEECETRAEEMPVANEPEFVIIYVSTNDNRSYGLKDDSYVSHNKVLKIEKKDNEIHMNNVNGTISVLPMNTVRYYKMGGLQ